MDKEAQDFLDSLKNVVESVDENTKVQKEILSVLKKISDGDPNIKIPPMNVNLARLAFATENLVMELRRLLQVLAATSKLPTLFDIAKKILK